ncbi:hypothetical protein H6P81_016372 [Aristolochia fimbriata]|uniref:Uncharacterized protein n=1 Tax=Aristolochia fimbriata TaxID=158543 RepID=A0AAV7EBX6_ARIFI|nr:hypothetical protein H6P81_016372 [Aristolochia fimbriata]
MGEIRRIYPVRFRTFEVLIFKASRRGKTNILPPLQPSQKLSPLEDDEGWIVVAWHKKSVKKKSLPQTHTTLESQRARKLAGAKESPSQKDYSRGLHASRFGLEDLGASADLLSTQTKGSF